MAFKTSMTNVVASHQIHKNITHIVCKEHLYTVYVVMYYPKNFYLIETIDKKIGQFLASGIVSRLIDKYVDMRFWNMKKEQSDPHRLTFNHLRGAFTLWIGLCAVSAIVLLVEVLIKLFNF